MEVTPTIHECNQYSKTGKMPDSLKKRKKIADSESKKELKGVLSDSDATKEEKQVAKERLNELKVESDDTEETKEDNPKADNVFDQLPDDTEFPHHYGGGNYYLSNGKKVSGKENAVEAQQEIDQG